MDEIIASFLVDRRIGRSTASAHPEPDVSFVPMSTGRVSLLYDGYAEAAATKMSGPMSQGRDRVCGPAQPTITPRTGFGRARYSEEAVVQATREGPTIHSREPSGRVEIAAPP
jgi:hypothetical protein